MSQTRITNEWIMDRFDHIYPFHRVAFARLLVTLRRDFDGDLDAMLVLLTLTLGVHRQDWGEALLGNLEPAERVHLTNTQSIALSTGIPRESVRRKLETMRERGWIERDASGNWKPRSPVAADLRASTNETVSYIRTMAAAILSAEPKRRS